MFKRSLFAVACLCLIASIAQAASNQPPQGFTALFNGKNLDGWWGESTTDPRSYINLPADELAAKKQKSLDDINKHWSVEKGELVNDGHGLYLTTDKFYGDFELLLEYKTVAKADSGVYLRGVPQVQIWDYTEEGGKWKIGADKGSGGLWNNPKDWPGKDPAVLADKPFGQWNKLRVIMVGERVSVWLNDKLVVDHARMKNYYDKKGSTPIPAVGPIQLQTHGGEIRWRDVFIREIGTDEANQYLTRKSGEGFEQIFNGKNFDGWAGPTDNYEVTSDGNLMCKPGKGGTIYTNAEYSDFVARLEFKLPPGGNNGLAIRYPGHGNAAYDAMCECQVLDNTADKYKDLKPQQYHGSIYAQFPAQRGYLRPVGQWNFQTVTVKGHRLICELNGTVITDCDVSTLKPGDFMYDIAKFKGRMRTEGHFGFAGHNDPVQFRNIYIKKLDGAAAATSTSAQTTASDKTVKLFDGSNLDHWNYKKDGWKIEDGAMALQNKGGYIWTKKTYGDFVLDLEVKMSKGCNSGIFIRTNPKNAVQGGFEIQVLDSYGKKNPGKHDFTALYDAKAPSKNVCKAPGEWNHVTITAKGPMYTVVANGEKVLEATLDDWDTPNKNPDGSKNKFKTALKDLPRTGHIGFQDHGHPVWYRNITIKPLD